MYVQCCHCRFFLVYGSVTLWNSVTNYTRLLNLYLFKSVQYFEDFYSQEVIVAFVFPCLYQEYLWKPIVYSDYLCIYLYLYVLQYSKLKRVSLLQCPHRPWPDRQWGLCIFDDVIEHCSPASFKYAEYFLRPMLQYVCDSSPEVRQAAAYGLGVMAQYGGDNYRPFCTGTDVYLVTCMSFQVSLLFLPHAPSVPPNILYLFLFYSLPFSKISSVALKNLQPPFSQKWK